MLRYSRVILKFSGQDVTQTFSKMMLLDCFNYAEMDLLKRHNYLLVEELK